MGMLIMLVMGNEVVIVMRAVLLRMQTSACEVLKQVILGLVILMMLRSLLRVTWPVHALQHV
eukprot:2433364-Karenia_brevis.AAC.1